jgi:putative addiction module component (TIGR02574 family)
MDDRVERLAAETLTLPPNERAELAHRLIESLDDATDAEAGAAGHAEALRRLDEIKQGAVQPIAGDVLFERLRQRLAR